MNKLLYIIYILFLYIIYKNYYNKNNNNEYNENYNNTFNENIKSIEEQSEICVFIYSCHINEELYKKYLNKKNIFIILGKEDLDQKYFVEGNILYLKVKDNYFSLPSTTSYFKRQLLFSKLNGSLHF